MMEMYCDQDILILMVNAPFIVRLVLAFATTIMSKRQPLSRTGCFEVVVKSYLGMHSRKVII